MQPAERRSSVLCRDSVAVQMLNVLGCMVYVKMLGVFNYLKSKIVFVHFFFPKKATNYSMQHLQTGWTFQKRLPRGFQEN